jgi:hypothetical protein
MSRTVYNLLYKNGIQHGRLLVLHKESGTGTYTTQLFYSIHGKAYNLRIEAEGMLKYFQGRSKLNQSSFE